jgi:hypothetical protein
VKLVAFFILLIGTVAFAWYLDHEGDALRAAGTKRAIVDLELAWTQPVAREVVEKWRAATVLDVARRNIYVDFGFIAFYAPLLALVCFSGASHRTGGWRVAGVAIAWGMLAAGALDVIENLGMLPMLDGNFTFVTLVSICAATKFVLLGIGVTYILAAHLVR